MSCTCVQGQCDNVNNCYICVNSIGSQFLSGNLFLQQFTAQIPGAYTVTAKILSGNPPSSFQIIVNGNILSTIPGTGGQATVPVQINDLVQVQVSWGFSYSGGSFEIITCPPQVQSPTPVSSVPSYLIYVLIAAIIALALLIIVRILKLQKFGG